jgi:hypothetical protein
MRNRIQPFHVLTSTITQRKRKRTACPPRKHLQPTDEPHLSSGHTAEAVPEKEVSMECRGRGEGGGGEIYLMPSSDCGNSVEGEEEEEEDAMTSAHARRAAAQQLIRAMMMWRRCIGDGQGLGERAAFSLHCSLE